MPVSMPVTIDEFALILGYPRTPLVNLGLALGLQNVNPDGSSAIPLNRLARLQQLYTQLLDYEAKLETAKANSMARTLGSLSLDYGSHIALLEETANRKLEEMSAILNLPIYFNRVTGTYPQDDAFYSAYGVKLKTSSPYSYQTLI